MLTLYSTPNNVKNRGFVCVIVNVLSVVNPDNGCTVFSPVKNSMPVPRLKLSKFLNDNKDEYLRFLKTQQCQ